MTLVRSHRHTSATRRRVDFRPAPASAASRGWPAATTAPRRASIKPSGPHLYCQTRLQRRAWPAPSARLADLEAEGAGFLTSLRLVIDTAMRARAIRAAADQLADDRERCRADLDHHLDRLATLDQWRDVDDDRYLAERKRLDSASLRWTPPRRPMT